MTLVYSYLRDNTLAEAPKRALGAFLPDPCPCGLAALATQPFHPEAIDICAAVITQGEIILLVTQFCEAPVASLDGTLHRQLHALEQSPAYFCRATSLSLN
jgi:hypothetical protein